jgi:hypothetical protein
VASRGFFPTCDIEATTTAILPNTLQNGFSFTKEAIILPQPQPKPCQRGPNSTVSMHHGLQFLSNLSACYLQTAMMAGRLGMQSKHQSTKWSSLYMICILVITISLRKATGSVPECNPNSQLQVI